MMTALELHRDMAEPSQPGARQSAERAARKERLAKALRDNLRRRKEQARARRRSDATASERGREGDGEPQLERRFAVQ
jgi:hypothetical protein